MSSLCTEVWSGWADVKSAKFRQEDEDGRQVELGRDSATRCPGLNVVQRCCELGQS